MEALYNSPELFAADPYVIPLPFQTDAYTSDKPLCIGWYEDNGFCQATEPCKRVVREAKRILEAKGHRLVEFVPPDVGKAVYLLMRVFTVNDEMALNCYEFQFILKPKKDILRKPYQN